MGRWGTFRGCHAAATDGDGVSGRDLVRPSGGTLFDVFDFTCNADGVETSQADVGSPDIPSVTLTYDYLCSGQPQDDHFFKIMPWRVAPSVRLGVRRAA